MLSVPKMADKKLCHTVMFVFLHFLREEKMLGQIFLYHCEAREKLYQIRPCGILFGQRLSQDITA